MQLKPSIGCVIITHNAAHHLPRCLPPLLNSSLKPRVLVVNSSSEDNTVALAKEMGAETLVVPRSEFNHGATREKARRYLNTDILCMHTPDAYLEDENALQKLVLPILEGQAQVTYGKQAARKDAGYFEKFPRDFNYPAESHVRTLDDFGRFGVYTFFCSNSFAAYDNRVLESIGGFEPVLLGEDAMVVCKVLQQGGKVAYVAEAVAEHSHKYSLWHDFRRSFDTGLARKSFEHLFPKKIKDSQRGFEYSRKMRQELFQIAPHYLPYAFFHCLFKWIGYEIGARSVSMPLWFKRLLSTQDFYWK